MKQKYYPVFLLVLTMAVLLAACSSDPKTATSITLSKTELTMNIGDKDTLKATVVPTNADIKTVAWSTTDSTIVTVDNNGIVTAKALGTARVWASAQDGTPVKTGCAITVAVPEEDIDSLDVEDEDSIWVVSLK